MICFSNAFLSLFGKGLPLLSARLMIPRQAFALKKYFRATHGSKTSNKEHTLASLGHAEKLRIQYSPSFLSEGTPSFRAVVNHSGRFWFSMYRFNVSNGAPPLVPA